MNDKKLPEIDINLDNNTKSEKWLLLKDWKNTCLILDEIDGDDRRNRIQNFWTNKNE